MEIYVENPGGERVGPLDEALGVQRWMCWEYGAADTIMGNRHPIM